MSSRPSKQDFPTYWSYRQANRAWLRAHGGYVWTTLAIAILFGAWTGSVLLMVLLVVFALVGTADVRSRP